MGLARLPARTSGFELGLPRRSHYENLCQHNDKDMENVRHAHTCLWFAEGSTEPTSSIFGVRHYT